MKFLFVSIEINGEFVHVGTIKGKSSDDYSFQYDSTYIEGEYPAISISLPINYEPFSPEKTRNYFEGLLPEGFARKSLSNLMHVDEEDYISILEALGAECLGALRITDGEEPTPSYQSLSVEEVRALAEEGISKSTEIIMNTHLSLTGASGKVGLYYHQANDSWYRPVGTAPSSHIVKQSHVRLENIVTNEQLCLLTASNLGISVPESFIVNTGDNRDERVLFATKRFDRIIEDPSKVLNGLAVPHRLHQEDFAQAMGISSSRKYEQATQNYLAQSFALIRNNSSNPIEDQSKLWSIIVFDYLVGNTDNHIKNLSLLYSGNLKDIRLAPAYDIVSTMIYQGSTSEMSIGIGGEREISRINRDAFINAASEIGLNPRIAIGQFDKMTNEFEKAIKESSKVLYDQGYTNAHVIKDKILRYGGYGILG